MPRKRVFWIGKHDYSVGPGSGWSKEYWVKRIDQDRKWEIYCTHLENSGRTRIWMGTFNPEEVRKYFEEVGFHISHEDWCGMGWHASSGAEVINIDQSMLRQCTPVLTFSIELQMFELARGGLFLPDLLCRGINSYEGVTTPNPVCKRRIVATVKQISGKCGVLAAMAISGLLMASSIAAEPTTLTGSVTRVRDGDTIEVGGIPIRLDGVSAPELDEPLGEQSKAFLRDLVSSKSLRCELNGQKTYDRFVGICYLNGIDISVLVVEAGLALDCPRYSGGRYSEFEMVSAREQIELPSYCQ